MKYAKVQLSVCMCMSLVDYSEDQVIQRHNDSSDSLVDAVPATGDKIVLPMYNVSVLLILSQLNLCQKYALATVLLTVYLSNHINCWIQCIHQ